MKVARGPHPRGVCRHCLTEKRVKADGTMGAHGIVNASGYTVQRTCPGVDQIPLAEGTVAAGEALYVFMQSREDWATLSARGRRFWCLAFEDAYQAFLTPSQMTIDDPTEENQ